MKKQYRLLIVIVCIVVVIVAYKQFTTMHLRNALEEMYTIHFSDESKHYEYSRIKYEKIEEHLTDGQYDKKDLLEEIYNAYQMFYHLEADGHIKHIKIDYEQRISSKVLICRFIIRLDLEYDGQVESMPLVIEGSSKLVKSGNQWLINDITILGVNFMEVVRSKSEK